MQLEIPKLLVLPQRRTLTYPSGRPPFLQRIDVQCPSMDTERAALPGHMSSRVCMSWRPGMDDPGG